MSDRVRSLLLRAVGGWCVVGLLTSCVTGDRPTLEPVPEIDDPAAAAVLQRLDRAGSIPFTATYEITPSTTGVPVDAVVQQLDGQRVTTIGDVEYRTDGTTAATCVTGTDECIDEIDPARVSDLNITPQFWASSTGSRLTIDAARRVGFSEGSNETIADRPAACAAIPVLGGTVQYCALDAGVLARYFGADVTIELTSFSSEVDPAVFETVG